MGPVGRNWDFKELKSLQIFFFDDCRTVEVVPKELVESMLAPWDDEDQDEETKKQKDNMLKPWSKKANADTSNDVDNKLTAWGDMMTITQRRLKKFPSLTETDKLSLDYSVLFCHYLLMLCLALQEEPVITDNVFIEH